MQQRFGWAVAPAVRRTALLACACLFGLTSVAAARRGGVEIRLDVVAPDKTNPKAKDDAPAIDVTVIGGPNLPYDKITLTELPYGKAPVTIRAHKKREYIEGTDTVAICLVIQGQETWFGNGDIETDNNAKYLGVGKEMVSIIDQLELGRAGPPGSSGCIVSYSTGASLKQPMVPLVQITGASLGTQQDYYKKIGADLVQGVTVGMAELAKVATVRKVLIVVGDGTDTNPEAARGQLAVLGRAAATQSIDLYAVIYRAEADRGPSVIRALTPASQTASSVESIDDALRFVIGQIKNRYYVTVPGYDPRIGAGFTWDGKEHALIVKFDEKELDEYPLVMAPRWDPPSSGRSPWLIVSIALVSLVVLIAGVNVFREMDVPLPAPLLFVAAPLAEPSKPQAPRKTVLPCAGEDSVPIVERLLAALMRDPSAQLIRCDGEVIAVRVGRRALIAIVAAGATLPATARALVREHRYGVLHIVAIGGEAEQVAPILNGAMPFWQVLPTLGFDHLSSKGVHTRVAGSKSKPLARAIARLATTEPVDDLAPLVAAGEVAKVEWTERSAPLRRGVPWATIAIVLACVGVFALERYWSGGYLVLDRMGHGDGGAIRHGAVWRLLSSLFLHRDSSHLIGTMFWLVVLGPFLEWTLGTRRFLLLYGLAGLIGSIAQSQLVAGAFMGASGAVFGVWFSFLGLAIRPRGLLRRSTRAWMCGLLAPWWLITVVSLFALGGGPYHFGGGLTGLALVLSGAITRGVTPRWTAAREPSRRLKLAACAAAAAMAASVVVAVLVGRPWELTARVELTTVALGDSGLALEVPRVFGPPKIDVFDDRIGYSVGNSDQPVWAFVELTRLPYTVAPNELVREGETDQWYIKMVDGYPWVRWWRPYVDGTGSASRWITVLGDRELVIDVFRSADMPPPWYEVERRLLASIGRQAKRARAAQPAPVTLDPTFWVGCTVTRDDERLEIECGALLHLDRERVHKVVGSERAAARLRVIDERIGRLTQTTSNRRTRSLAPLVDALVFATAWARDGVTVQGRGVVAATTIHQRLVDSFLCLDARPAGATPSCEELITELSLHGLPAALEPPQD